MSEDSTPADLRALFDEERAAAIPIRKGARERVYAAVLRRTGPGGAGGSGDGPGGGAPTGSPPLQPIWTAVLVSSVLSGLVGFGLGALSQTDVSSRDETPAPSAVTATRSSEGESTAHRDPEVPTSARPTGLGHDSPRRPDSGAAPSGPAGRTQARPSPTPEPELDATASEVEPCAEEPCEKRPGGSVWEQRRSGSRPGSEC